jgi:hypothetical protein
MWISSKEYYTSITESEWPDGEVSGPRLHNSGPVAFSSRGPKNVAFFIDFNLEIYLILSINRSDVAFASHIATLLKSETKLETRVIYINLVFEIFYL